MLRLRMRSETGDQPEDGDLARIPTRDFNRTPIQVRTPKNLSEALCNCMKVHVQDKL